MGTLLLLVVMLGMPLVITLSNVAALVLGRRYPRRLQDATDIAVFAAGIPLTMLLTVLFGFVEWNIPINYIDAAYTPIAIESMPTFMTLCVLAIVGYGAVRLYAQKLPPLTAALCYAAMYLGMILAIMVCVQLFEQATEFPVMYLMIFPINYVLCSLRLMRDSVRFLSELAGSVTYTNPILRWSARLLGHGARFILIAFLLTVPLMGAVILIMLLFGQQPDAMIRAFTQTTQWTLSQQIPPPALTYEGHYLCTVAARGDAKVVKPLRAGKRHGRLIVVNRQLLVANAFEDLIAEKTPRFHRLVRGLYDTCGRPISVYINTPRRSNAVYFLMKPLEWLFTLILYLFDSKPEDRIAMQYTK